MGRTVVIGVGNPYRCDDGVGPAVLELLVARGVPEVLLAASLGDTAELIELWDGARLAIVVDALRVESPHPGRVHRVVVRDPPGGHGGAASSHAMDLGEAVELARVLGRMPAELVLYVIEVSRVGYGEGLSSAVDAAARRVARDVATELASAKASRRNDGAPRRAGTFGTAGIRRGG